MQNGKIEEKFTSFVKIQKKKTKAWVQCLIVQTNFANFKPNK